MTEEELDEKYDRPFKEIWFEVGYRIRVIEISRAFRVKRDFINREMFHNSYSKYFAESYLTKEQLKNVLKIKELYSDDTIFNFNYREWLKYIKKVLACYDLVAPICKFGKVKNQKRLIKLDEKKLPYREVAKEMIACGEMGSEKWNTLLQEFQNKFSKSYKYNSDE